MKSPPKTPKITERPARKIDTAYIQHFDEFISQFKSESDRAALILAVSKIDYSLYQLIKRFLIPNANSKDELLDPDENGPLSAFSARINLCYRLGIITSEFVSVLHMIRKTRNDFAHQVSTAKLDDAPHRDRIRAIVKMVSATDMFNDVKETYFFDKMGLVADFFTSLTMIIVRLDSLYDKVNPLDQTKAYSIVPPNY